MGTLDLQIPRYGRVLATLTMTPVNAQLFTEVLLIWKHCGLEDPPLLVVVGQRIIIISWRDLFKLSFVTG